MIYWFTGQPAHGKTVLANKLKETLLPNAFRIDGDEMRELFTNKDYSVDLDEQTKNDNEVMNSIEKFKLYTQQLDSKNLETNSI